MMTYFRPIAFLFVLLILPCLQVQAQQSGDLLVADSSETLFQGSEMDDFIVESLQYLEDRDLDGDGLADDILFDYSGGAHCCYYMSLKLSSEKDTLSYPFHMDGGYLVGVDGSWPDKFRIEDFDGDGRMEIRMKIATYNGVEDPWTKKWTRRYGIHQNDIVFEYSDGKMVLRDDLDKPKINND